MSSIADRMIAEAQREIEQDEAALLAYRQATKQAERTAAMALMSPEQLGKLKTQLEATEERLREGEPEYGRWRELRREIARGVYGE